jgi:putative tricarboxylic transport membrane protein
MKRDDSLSALIWLAFSLVVIVESYRLDPGTFHSPQAGFLPFVAGIALAILSLTLFMTTVFAKTVVFEKGKASSFNKEAFSKVLYVALSVFIYAILLNPLGFVLTTILFIGFLLRAIDPQKWYIVVVVALAASLASYLLFDVLLKVPLPRGPLGF